MACCDVLESRSEPSGSTVITTCQCRATCRTSTVTSSYNTPTTVPLFIVYTVSLLVQSRASSVLTPSSETRLSCMVLCQPHTTSNHHFSDLMKFQKTLHAFVHHGSRRRALHVSAAGPQHTPAQHTPAQRTKDGPEIQPVLAAVLSRSKLCQSHGLHLFMCTAGDALNVRCTATSAPLHDYKPHWHAATMPQPCHRHCRQQLHPGCGHHPHSVRGCKPEPSHAAAHALSCRAAARCSITLHNVTLTFPLAI